MLNAAGDKSFVDDLAASWYCKCESSLCCYEALRFIPCFYDLFFFVFKISICKIPRICVSNKWCVAFLPEGDFWEIWICKISRFCVCKGTLNRRVLRSVSLRWIDTSASYEKSKFSGSGTWGSFWEWEPGDFGRIPFGSGKIMAYRSFRVAKIAARGVRKVTTGTGVDVTFLMLDFFFDLVL